MQVLETISLVLDIIAYVSGVMWAFMMARFVGDKGCIFEDECGLEMAVCGYRRSPSKGTLPKKKFDGFDIHCSKHQVSVRKITEVDSKLS
jgi:hypothetical protein